MSTENIQETNLTSLVSIEPCIAGRQLQPFSAGRLQLCRQAGLKIVTGGAADLSQSELELELLAFYLIHAFPLNEVLAACAEGREKLFADHIQPLSFDFPARDLPKVMAFLKREFTGVEAANVEPVQKRHASMEAAPPNI